MLNVDKVSKTWYFNPGDRKSPDNIFLPKGKFLTEYSDGFYWGVRASGSNIRNNGARYIADGFALDFTMIENACI